MQKGLEKARTYPYIIGKVVHTIWYLEPVGIVQ